MRRAWRCSQGLQRYDRIIVGAYSDRSGGVCPMLAAHRCGGRTDFRSFARAWDRFTGAGRRARKATERELRRSRPRSRRASGARRRSGRRCRRWRPASRPSLAAGRQSASTSRAAPGCGPFRRWDGYREAVAAALRQVHGRGGRSRRRGAERGHGRAEREEELAGPRSASAADESASGAASFSSPRKEKSDDARTPGTHRR